jgi:hypothetical protein
MAQTRTIKTKEVQISPRLYSAWQNMKSRCDSFKHDSYHMYGAIGITYHDSFKTIQGFLECVGDAPSDKHKFARIDKTGNFEPGNVHWYLPKKKHPRLKWLNQ